MSGVGSLANWAQKTKRPISALFLIPWPPVEACQQMYQAINQVMPTTGHQKQCRVPTRLTGQLLTVRFCTDA
jgi:hypothetical protein